MKISLLLVLIFPLLIEAIYEDEAHPIPQPDLTIKCDPCFQLKKGRDKVSRCVRKTKCCEVLNSTINCLINPCLSYKKYCKLASHCIINNCRSSGCYTIYYDKNWMEINPTYCNSKKNQTPLQGYQIPRKMLNTHKTVIFPKIPLNSFYYQDISLTKPGTCNKDLMNHGEIIQLCYTECHLDKDCSGHYKCCNNGCGKLCTNKYVKEPRNYLNVPVVVTKPNIRKQS